MNINDALRELEKAGSEQTRKTYARHGVTGPMFGVSYATLGALKKKIKTDHTLAKHLWASGNHDARILATMIADPLQATEHDLEGWVSDLENHVLGDALSKFAAQTPHARKKMQQWTRSADETIGMAGWCMLAAMASSASHPDDLFDQFIARIQQDIHAAPNRARHAMNRALIAIGSRGGTLMTKALAAAKRIGPVQVDHGDTDCQTPDAATYIAKVVAHRSAKAKKTSASAPTRKGGAKKSATKRAKMAAAR